MNAPSDARLTLEDLKPANFFLTKTGPFTEGQLLGRGDAVPAMMQYFSPTSKHFGADYQSTVINLYRQYIYIYNYITIYIYRYYE